ncbi:DUF819 family protein [Mangrovibacterium sp.]|uniref:DUF819 family protein n=1 Tax=Mangrovibacterium sp. TaxID=1961364 RepID=UPI003563EFDA
MFAMVFLFVFYLCFPAFMIYLTKKSTLLEKIGAVVLAYLFGLALGNIGLLPQASSELRYLLAGKTCMDSKELTNYIKQGLLTESDLLPNQIASMQELLMTLTIPLAIPLLLFSLDLRRWIRLAYEALFSLFLGLVSLVFVIICGFFILKNYIPDAWKIAGMLVGIYTGGTPNLASISAALDVSPNLFILTHTYDLLLGSFFLLFLMTIAQATFNRFLPAFQSAHKSATAESVSDADFVTEDFTGMLMKPALVQMAKALGLSLFIFGVSGAVSLLVPKSAQMVTVILGITTLGLLASLIPAVNKLKKSFSLGMYLILIFSLLVSSMANLQAMLNINFVYIFLFVAVGVVGSMVVHVFLSWLFKVDSDTTIITITALTYSPPFVPVVASALKNKEVIISGLTVGILGYAFGNYLGVALAYLLERFM